MTSRGGYQPRSKLVKDENGDLLADSHNILSRWKNYFSQLLNVHRVIKTLSQDSRCPDQDLKSVPSEQKA
jgi:hypothetical protein